MDEIMVGKTLSNTIIIGQYRPSGAIPGGGDQKFVWSQINSGGGHFTPLYLTYNLTYYDGSGPVCSQAENFELLKTLLMKGEGPDVSGLTWKLDI